MRCTYDAELFTIHHQLDATWPGGFFFKIPHSLLQSIRQYVAWGPAHDGSSGNVRRGPEGQLQAQIPPIRPKGPTEVKIQKSNFSLPAVCRLPSPSTSDSPPMSTLIKVLVRDKGTPLKCSLRKLFPASHLIKE